MTKNGKRELLEAIRPRSLRASTTEKTHILGEFVAATGYHRKYAIRLLKHGRKRQRREKRGRSSPPGRSGRRFDQGLGSL